MVISTKQNTLTEDDVMCQPKACPGDNLLAASSADKEGLSSLTKYDASPVNGRLAALLLAVEEDLICSSESISSLELVLYSVMGVFLLE